jgi:branched-chain amino acid transport system substrate-binding protein
MRISTTRRHFLRLLALGSGGALLTACAQPAPAAPTAAPKTEAKPTAQPTTAAAQPAAQPTSAPAQPAPAAKANVPAGPIKMGVLAARAGVTAAVGQAGQRATEWWAERVNGQGGILGRQVQLVIEEESNPKDTVERFRKLVLQDQVDVVVGGISTGVTLAVGPVAEEMGAPLLMWDGTTQNGIEETITSPTWIFRSADNEVEAIAAAILTAKYFPGIKTVAGIGNDYSYGRDCWATYQAVLKRYNPDVQFVLELFPKLGDTDFTSQVSAIRQSNADLLMCSFWSGDAPILMKQAAAVGLFANMKGVFTTAGGVHDSLKKEFTPEGLLLGYNSMYFDDPNGSPLLKQFVGDYRAKHNEYPAYECDHAYFCAEVYKAGVERAYQAANAWPSKEQVVKAIEGVEVESLSGRRSMREDHIMMGTWYQGITTHKNSYDFATIDPVEALPTTRIMKPAGAKLMEWIAGMQL